MKSIVFFTVLLLLASLALCTATCPKGQYWYQPRPWFKGECAYCNRGYYCPGDDNTYQCTGNTITNQYGMTACVACTTDFPLASPVNTFCMPSDVPKDASYLFLESFGAQENIQLSSKSRHLILEMAFEEFTEIAALTFYNGSSAAPPFGMYLSTKSGNPSEHNYEMKAFGQNVTFAFQKPANTYYVPFYLTVDAPGDLRLYVTTEGSYNKVVVFDKPVVTVDIEDHQLAGENPYVFFKVPNINQRSRVNITFTVNVDFTNTLVSGLYASPNTELQYPTTHNYKQKAYDYIREGTSISSSLLLDDVLPGTLYFSGSTELFTKRSKLRITASVDITPKK